MRVALLISGMFRHYDLCLPTIFLNVVEPLGCDVFVETWENTLLEKKTLDHEGSSLAPEDVIKNIQNIKDYNIEKNIELDVSVFEFANRTDKNGIYMFYKIKKSFELMEKYEKLHNFKYDYVIRGRSDLFFDKTFSPDMLSKKPQEFENKKCLRMSTSQVFHGVCDQFFWAERDIMEKACSVYDDMVRYHTEDGIRMHAEIMLAHHLRDNDIKASVIRCAPTFFLARSPDRHHDKRWLHCHSTR